MPRMNDRLLSAVSLCRKAGKLLMGNDVVREAAQNGTAFLVLFASDLAPRSEKLVRLACGEKTPARVLPFTMDELSNVTGRRVGILAVCEKGFAKMIGELLPAEEAESH